MPAGIEETDWMASGMGVMPWHGLGTIMPERNMSSSEAIELAKLSWLIEMQSVYLKNGDEVPQCRAIVRQDTGRILGTIGDNYVPCQNAEAFKFLDEMLMDPSGPFIETCGSLHGGAIVWIMVAMKDVIVVGDDKIAPFLLFTNRNMGRRSIELSQVNVRVVCQNTLAMAETGKLSNIKIRHIGGLINSIGKAREMLGIAEQNNATMAGVFNLMMESYAEPERVDAVLEQLIQGNPYAEPNVQARTQTFRDRCKYLALNGSGNSQYAGTWWSVYNGITDWSDHHKQIARGSKDKASTMAPEEVRFVSNLSGPSAKLKSQALTLISEELEDATPFHSVSSGIMKFFDESRDRELAKGLGMYTAPDKPSKPQEPELPVYDNMLDLVLALDLDCGTTEKTELEMATIAQLMERKAERGSKAEIERPKWMDKTDYTKLHKAVVSNMKRKVI